jgi:hypothetical protein
MPDLEREDEDLRANDRVCYVTDYSLVCSLQIAAKAIRDLPMERRKNRTRDQTNDIIHQSRQGVTATVWNGARNTQALLRWRHVWATYDSKNDGNGEGKDL